MRTVVTGGAGFIGSHLTAALLRLGHDVVVIDNLFSGKRGNLEDVERELIGVEEAGELRFIETDILDSDGVAEALTGARAVFHQAAIASVPRSFADPAVTFRVNVEGTVRLLEACRDAGVERFVMASSSSVYGDTPTLPKHEEMTPKPLSPYALSKLVDEELLAMWSREYGLRTVGLRYFNIFGPRQDPRSEYAAVVPKFITRVMAGLQPTIFGDGMQSRDFTFVDNAVQANLRAAAMDPAGGSVDTDATGIAMNVGIGERYTLLDVLAAINEILGTRVEPDFAPARVGDVRDSQASIERARSTIGFAPAVGFRDGLERTVAWYLERLEAPPAARAG